MPARETLSPLRRIAPDVKLGLREFPVLGEVTLVNAQTGGYL